VHLKYTNKLSGAIAGETIGVKILILILMSTNLVITSFSRITPVLLNCGIDRIVDAVATFRQVSTRKRREEEEHKKPRVPKQS
jgi:predicted signal transduction protein with EAL and GGDEF domain